jgi:hypothetical protein
VTPPRAYLSAEASIRRRERTAAFAALLLAFLAACATTEKARESWAGATYDDVVRAWGAPVRSGKLSDGAEVHTWMSEAGPTIRPGPSIGFGVGGFGGGRGGGGVGVGVGASMPIGEGSVTPPARCERTLTFRDGRLAEQAWFGPDEICSEYSRRK